MNRKKIKKEWHLYSIFAFTVALTTIIAIFFTGTPQTLGIAFVVLISTCLFESDVWKNQPVEMHKIILIISSIVFLLTIIVSTILVNVDFLNKNKRTINN